jgi:hypothetical protein
VVRALQCLSPMGWRKERGGPPKIGEIGLLLCTRKYCLTLPVNGFLATLPMLVSAFRLVAGLPCSTAVCAAFSSWWKVIAFCWEKGRPSAMSVSV